MMSSQEDHSPERAQDADIVHPSSNVFPFLKLPGETRNVIYNYLLAPTPGPISRGSMPLIQFANICTQIRCEFRPMLLSQHILNIDEACRYIETFLIASKVDINHCKTFVPVTKVHMAVGQGRYDEFRTTDLIPLLRLLVNHPMDIKVTFTDDLDIPVEPLKQLLRYRSKYWASLLNRSDLVGILKLRARTLGGGFHVYTNTGLRRQANGLLTFSDSYNISCSNLVGPCETRIEKIRVFEGKGGRLMIDMSRYSDTE